MSMRTALAAIALLPSLVLAAPGALDPTFGTDGTGRVVTELHGAAARANAVAVQADGRIVIAGTVAGGIGIARYDANGIPDTTFGDGDGTKTIVSGAVLEAWTVAVDPNGKILVGGNTDKGDYLLFRFTSAGQPDQSFGPYDDGGLIYSPTTPSLALGYGLAVQADGQIILGGPFPNAQNDVALVAVRLAADGKAVDTSWVLDTDFRGPSKTAFLLQDDGSLLAVVTPTPPAFGVIRVTPAGVVDATFGTGGLASAALAGPSPAALARQADGKIVVAGGATAGLDSGFGVARFTADGQPDPSFAGGATTLGIPGRDFVGEAVVVQANGQIVVAGFEVDGVGPLHFALARFNADGSPDTSFGTGGVQTTDFGGRSAAHAVFAQGADRIVAVGGGGPRSVMDFALARYDASPGTSDGGGGGGTDVCAATPPTLASVVCRIDALSAAVASGDVGKLRKKLLKLLGKAKAKVQRAEAVAGGAKAKPYNKALKGAGAALRAFQKVVGSKKAGKQIAAETQAAITTASGRVAGELGTIPPR
jgi:uncharacterized delta-60 repeat protein